MSWPSSSQFYNVVTARRGRGAKPKRDSETLKNMSDAEVLYRAGVHHMVGRNDIPKEWKTDWVTNDETHRNEAKRRNLL